MEGYLHSKKITERRAFTTQQYAQKYLVSCLEKCRGQEPVSIYEDVYIITGVEIDYDYSPTVTVTYEMAKKVEIE